MRNKPADCVDITGQKCGRTMDGGPMGYHLISSPGVISPGESKSECGLLYMANITLNLDRLIGNDEQE